MNNYAENVGSVECEAVSSTMLIFSFNHEMRDASNYNVMSNSTAQKSTLHLNQYVEATTQDVPILVPPSTVVPP